MEQIIQCPKCNAREGGCSYCEEVGYLISTGSELYSITLDSANKPVKGHKVGDVPKAKNETSFTDRFFPTSEPHDLIWFRKQRKQK